jgi:hypothetical protein
MKRLVAILALIIAVAATTVASDGVLNVGDGMFDLALTAETGFVKVLTHTITIGDPLNNDEFNYVTQGGQEILAPFSRFTSELTIASQHTIVFLYQPLELVTQSRFESDVTLDDVTFNSGQIVDITYSFPFFRVSYLYDFVPDDALELALGLSLQLRNASLRFESFDSGTNEEELVIGQNLGPVPIIKLRAGYRFPGSVIPGAFVEFEADGFYASSAFINGASYDFTGSIFDASLRFGFTPQPGFDLFANIRGLGGGGSGTRGDAREFWTESIDGYTDNFLTTLSVTLGARLR